MTRNKLDQILVTRYLAGDESAFQALYQNYAPWLRTLALSWLDGFYREDADDIVQQVFLDFHKNRTVPINNVKGRLNNLLFRRLAKYLRDRNRLKRNPSRELHEHEIAVNDDPTTQSEYNELHNLLATLPKQERLCVEAYMTNRCRDYAAEINTSISNVKRWTHQGLKKLRDHYHDHYRQHASHTV